MKRIIIFTLLGIIVLLCGCGNRKDMTVDLTMKDIQDKLNNIKRHGEQFTPADEDFLELNFENIHGEKAIFWSEEGAIFEWGIFCFDDMGDKQEALPILENYLTKEEEALRAMEALYPSEDLSARRIAFEEAVVNGFRNCLYYIVGKPQEISNFEREITAAFC